MLNNFQGGLFVFFHRLNEICAARGTSPSAVAISIGRSKSNVTGWRNGQIPGADTVSKIAGLLNVTVDYLLERPPFDCWELINQNRAGFLHYVDIPKNVQYALWGINQEDPNQTPLINFINFIADAVISVEPTSEGDWTVEVKDAFKPQKNAPTDTGKGAVSDADIKFALFGNAEIDDEVLDEVKRFAKFAIEQKEQRKQSD